MPRRFGPDGFCRVLARGQDVQDKIAEPRFAAVALTLEEVALFKRIYGSRTDEDLAIVFGRPAADIAALGAQLCLAKDKAFVRRKAGKKLASKMPRWSAEELDVLRELYPDTPNLEIAKRLGRSVKSVVSKAHALDLKKNPDRLREMGRQNVALRHQRGARS